MSTAAAAMLRDLYERKVRAMRRRPSFGRAQGRASARASRDLSCWVELGDRALLVDLPSEDGGGAAGPYPGQLMRASVAACIALGYRLWAARLGVPIDAVEVELACDYDVRGQLGLSGEIPVGWQRMTVDVTIVSGASEEDVRRVVETADRLSAMLANLSPAIERAHRLRLRRPGEAVTAAVPVPVPVPGPR